MSCLSIRGEGHKYPVNKEAAQMAQETVKELVDKPVVEQNQAAMADMARKMFAAINQLRRTGLLNIYFRENTILIEWRDNETLYNIKMELDTSEVVMMIDVQRLLYFGIENVKTNAECWIRSLPTHPGYDGG